MSTDVAVNSCNSAPSSPKKRVKFLCSHGGKILPRPADGHLKYVGGETRVISVPRDIRFQELMKKLTYLIDEEMILKYQVVSEDLDALVSVKSDEDLRHMFDEINNYGSLGNPRLRAFLFPIDPLVMENQIEPHPLEQRYIDAINGIIRSPSFSIKQHGSLAPSGCSSPRSPDRCTIEAMNYHNSILGMHKVQSSPSICYQSSHYVHQLPPPQYYSNYRQTHHSGNQSPKPFIGHPYQSGGPERLVLVRSVGRTEGIKYQGDPALPQSYFYGSSHCSGTGNLPESPSPLSPRNGQGGMRAFDSAMGGDM